MKAQGAKFGLGSIILLGINSIFGMGIFFLPTTAMELVGPSSIFVYFAAMVAALLIAFCFAECAAIFSRNGAAYVYAKEAFGDFVGFEVGIMRWVSTIFAAATLAVGFVTTLEQILPILKAKEIYATVLLSFIAGLGILNICGVTFVRLISNIAAVAKIFPLFIFVCIGIFYVQGAHFTPWMPEELPLENFGSATLMVFFAFSGFESLAVASEEMHNPRRNLPIAIFVILLVTSLFYLLIHAVLIGILGPQLAQSAAPVAEAAELMVGDMGKLAVLFCMLAASFGTNVAASFTAPRSAVALAQDQMLPTIFNSTSRFGTPFVAIGITSTLTAIVAMTGSFAALASMSVVMRFVQYFPTCIAVLVFRRSHPEYISQFPKVLGILTAVLALCVIAWMGWHASSEALALGGGFLLFGAFLFACVKKSKGKGSRTQEYGSLSKIGS